MQLLGGQQGEAVGQIEADLPAEYAQRAGARAVLTPHAIGQHVGQQVEILPLGMAGGDDGQDRVHGRQDTVGIGPAHTQCRHRPT